MKLRPWVLGALLLAGVGVNLYLVVGERVVESEKTVRHRVERVDPLMDITFTKANRKSNLQSFGLTDKELDKALRRLNDLDDAQERNRSMLAMFLDQAGDQTRLDRAFCGSGQVRPRYAALAYLVKEEGGKRKALSLRRVSGLEYEGWAKTARIAEVYGELELASERKPDATVMGLAAILLGREQDVIDHSSHWGEGLRGRWSWDKVKKEHSGVDERVVEYLALMHLTLEVATAEGGFCDQ
jgi:hypothetical protein